MIATRPSRTAESVCFLRAVEHARPPDARIVDDPFAARFLGPTMRLVLATGLGPVLLPSLATFVAARHRYIDDALRAALRTGIAQVVVLGAGYDARAWRFADALAGRPVFEVDHPATQRRKARLSAGLDVPPVDVRRVPVDFQVDRLDTALVEAGFVPGRPTFFAWEGVTMYLRREAVRTTLTTLHALGGAGSSLALDAWFLLDHPGLGGAWHRFAANLLSLVGEPITFSLHPEDAGPFLRAAGWAVRDLADAAELTRRYVRDGRGVYPADYVLLAERAEV